LKAIAHVASCPGAAFLLGRSADWRVAGRFFAVGISQQTHYVFGCTGKFQILLTSIHFQDLQMLNFTSMEYQQKHPND